MKLHETIQAMTMIAFRIEEVQKQAVDLNKSALRLQIQMEVLMKDLGKIVEWSDRPTMIPPSDS